MLAIRPPVASTVNRTQSITVLTLLLFLTSVMLKAHASVVLMHCVPGPDSVSMADASALDHGASAGVAVDQEHHGHPFDGEPAHAVACPAASVALLAQIEVSVLDTGPDSAKPLALGELLGVEHPPRLRPPR